ncbi:MAG: tRNA-dihydrouridine synthase [Phycisphaerales bacterium]|nr:tRNA-dihydrouridine synthase [Phycisphaerales bacterium]
MQLSPLQLGPVRLATNLLLAPIAGYCDLAFRTVCREWGGVGLACTDLLSPQGLLRGTATSLDLARTNDFDKPVGMQLYGSDPDIMAEGARWAVEHGATVVDINMGCPVDKVTKKDGGSKLLTDLSRAVGIAERIVRELEKCPLSADDWARRIGDPAFTPQSPRIPVPLTCKIRLCWHTADFEAGRACSPRLARMLAEVGVVAVTVHGRTTEDKFAGTVRHDGIARVVEAVDGCIPIIGNGDVREPADAEAMIRATGCSGVMIGRGALSTPWLFRDTWAHLRRAGLGSPSSEHPDAVETLSPLPPTDEQKIATIRRYFELAREYRGDHYAMTQITRRVSWFSKRLGFNPDGTRSGLKPFKEAIRLARSPVEVHTALNRYLAGELRAGCDVQTEDAIPAS